MINESINNVRQAITALKQGELIILTDDQNREHEGDLVGLASFVTPEKINDALSLARGVLAVPMTRERAKSLSLSQMTSNNSEKFRTKFTVSVDHVDSKTGVSAYERANTIKQLANLSTTSLNFETPGHIFPLVAEDDDVLTRQGHTEGAVALAQIAGVPPVAFIIEILDQDGHMALEPALTELANKNHLLQLSIADIVTYRRHEEAQLVKAGVTVHLPTNDGDFDLTEYNVGQVEPDLLIRSRRTVADVPLVRLHSACATGDLFSSQRCDCGAQLQQSLQMIGQQGGALLYLRQEGRGIGLHEKLRSYVLQENAYDTYDANIYLNHQPDERKYATAAAVLKAAGLLKIRLLTNNPEKIQKLHDYGIEVAAHVPLITGINDINKAYMITKKTKFDHML
ncbi:3,4-dihydroxy-2-butanone-4-phosphate synthase [Leuconostoc sp. MS02]|uniref:3,4-dihydroxy-2-butanone-4-phosphate synthase n=1 Tax=Leuconostoc aquikimchii TaxID=3236804 RepID=A0ABV3S2M0_9LACO